MFIRDQGALSLLLRTLLFSYAPFSSLLLRTLLFAIRELLRAETASVLTLGLDEEQARKSAQAKDAAVAAALEVLHEVAREIDCLIEVRRGPIDLNQTEYLELKIEEAKREMERIDVLADENEQYLMQLDERIIQVSMFACTGTGQHVFMCIYCTVDRSST